MGFDRGDPQAPLEVVEFGDHGCSACAQFAVETLPTIEAEFIQTGRVRWKFVPFVLGAFRNSKQATAAAVCAAEQDAFWPMHDRLYQRQKHWSDAGDPYPIFRELMPGMGLDAARFERCYRDRGTARQVTELTRLAKRFAVNATPTFFVGERRIRGALPTPLFREVLLEAERSTRP
ncbi:MAG: thioredoxin domain-containing protein [candidate division NC10 bacterium]|nr:thioredoxin domain-containing protein [candidate division NC10 bacterium]